MKISVITVVRNDLSVLDTVKSVLSQKGADYECVVIDGASTDGTLQALAPFKRRIRLLSEPDKGIYDAMNKGLRLGLGQVIGFLNAGDIFAGPDSLAAISSAFAKDKKLGATWAGLEIRNAEGKLKRYWPPQDFQPGAFGRGWMPSHPTFYALRKELLSLGGFDTRYKLAADYDLMLKALELRKLKGQALPLTLVRMKSGGASQASLSALLRHNREAWRAAQAAGIFRGFFLVFVARKWMRKLSQLFETAPHS